MSALLGDGGPQAERSRRIEAQAYLQEPLPSFPGLPPAPASGSAASSGSRPDRDAAFLDVAGADGGAPARASGYVESARLTDERDFLRKYVERLLSQLRSLLHKYGEVERLKVLADPNFVVGDEDNATAATRGGTAQLNLQAPWLTAPEYTNPLFQAYDLKIQDLVRDCASLTCHGCEVYRDQKRELT